MSMDELRKEYERLVNVLHHYSMIAVGDMLGGGVYPATDVRVKPLRALEDARLLIRCEHQALLKLLLDKGVLTLEEYTRQLIEELNYMIRVLEEETGVESTETGLVFHKERNGKPK